MRSILFIFLCLPLFSLGQRRWNMNIGTEVSFFNLYENYQGLPISYNLGASYRSIEINIGLCADGLPSIGTAGVHDIRWSSFTFKHHFAVWRRAHGFLLINYQGRNYILNPVSTLTNIKYKDNYGNEVIARSDNFHLAIGLEPILWRRLAFPLSLGAGIVHHKGTEIQQPPNNIGYFHAFNKWEFSPFVSIGLRVYLFKRDIYGTWSDSQFF